MQSPSWEANWCAASQEIPRILWNSKVHYRTHKRPPRNTHIVQQIHIRWQQYTQGNYKNTHKTTYNNTHKTTTTIHTRQLKQYTQDNYNNTQKTTNNNKHKTS